MQLEGETNLLAKTVDILLVLLRGSCEDGSQLDGTGQQHTRLQADHLDILLLAHVVAGLKLHVELLTLTNLEGSHEEGTEHLLQLGGIAVEHTLEGLQQHGIA